jgi:N-carbamoylputrescine amidase
MQGHAAANMVPVIASNRIGREVGESCEISFYGSSFIAGPAGEIVAAADRDGRAVITARFDRAALAQDRASWGLFRDRRPDLYGPLRSLGGATGDP